MANNRILWQVIWLISIEPLIVSSPICTAKLFPLLYMELSFINAKQQNYSNKLMLCNKLYDESFITIPWGIFQSQNPIAMTSAETYNVLVSQTITIQLLGPLSAVASHLLSSLTHVADMLLFCKRNVIFRSTY